MRANEKPKKVDMNRGHIYGLLDLIDPVGRFDENYLKKYIYVEGPNEVGLYTVLL